MTSYYQTKIDAIIFELVRFYDSEENTISKITRTNIFKFLLNITKLQTHLSERKKRQTKTFTFPRQPKQLIQQIDALDETIKKYEHNLHLLSNSFKSILPKFHETFNSTIIQGEETDGTFYSSKCYEQALIVMSLTSIVILIIMQCITLKRNKTIIQHQPIPKFSPKPFLHI